MYTGTPDRSIPSRKLKPTGNSGIGKIALEVTISAARTYLGPYSREEMAIVLNPLVTEDKINYGFLLRLIKNVDHKYADPLLAEVGDETKKVFMRAGEINAILMTFERMESLTFDYEKGQIWWVCQQQSSGSYYSCLTILPSPHSFMMQLYFCGEDGREIAEGFATAFAADKWFSNGEPVYLIEAIKTPNGLRKEVLLVL